MVTYLQKLLQFTDSAAASAGRHARTVSSPPTGPSQPPTLGTLGGTPQQRPAGLSFAIYQQQQQQQHQQRHRPAQSMPHLTCTTGVEEEDTADSAHSSVLRGHDLRSSAGYGNELGIPGPSRHLTPLAQGLRSASLCSLPAAATAVAVETSTAAAVMTLHDSVGTDTAAMMTKHRTLLDPPVTQGESRWSSLSSTAHSSPVATHHTCSDCDGLAAVRQLGVGSSPPTGDHRGQACGPEAGAGSGRDLRDSAWGSVAAPLQPPSAPPLLR